MSTRVAGVEILCDDLQSVSEANLYSSSKARSGSAARASGRSTIQQHTASSKKFPKLIPSVSDSKLKLQGNLKNVDIRVKIYRKAFD